MGLRLEPVWSPTDVPVPLRVGSCLACRQGSRLSLTNVHVCLACRDADETKEWIEEKNQALNTDNYGHDLASVQALQRKHEGFERDLAALGDKVGGRRALVSISARGRARSSVPWSRAL